MKKIVAAVLITLFVLIIIGASIQAGETHTRPEDVGGALIHLAVLVIFPLMGLFYSARWRMKLSGHSWRVGRQTLAVILFWYSFFGVLLGLLTPLAERSTVGFVSGALVVAIWSCSAYACKRWQRRLRAEELSQAAFISASICRSEVLC
jgi:hypothetical protein